MKLNRGTGALALAGVLALSLAACGSDNPTGEDTTAASGSG